MFGILVADPAAAWAAAEPWRSGCGLRRERVRVVGVDPGEPAGPIPRVLLPQHDAPGDVAVTGATLRRATVAAVPSLRG